ncbi:hypothetical protein GCM10023237_68600 [Streptomyces coeruleoprunus]
MVQGGVTASLDSMRPMAMWEPPLLEIPGYRPLAHPSADFHLAGRALVLAPSVFCGPVPQLFDNPRPIPWSWCIRLRTTRSTRPAYGLSPLTDATSMLPCHRLCPRFSAGRGRSCCV